MKNNQEGIFSKIRGKSKALVGAAVLSSVLSGSATKVEAKDPGDERGQETKVEQSLEAREKSRTLAFLDELSRVESDEKDATAAYIDKKETAKDYPGLEMLFTEMRNASLR